MVRDRFVIESILGRGGMGVVYRAKDLRKEEMQDSDPYVTLKVLGGDFSRDPRMMMALQREARKAQSLAHPNIATVYDFHRDGDRVYITMEVLDGAPLNKVIEDHPQGLPRPKALAIIRGLCLGLAYAQNKGVPTDDYEAVKWFRKAAEQGDAIAQRQLGLADTENKGVRTDDGEAVSWYRKAADQGDTIAQRQLGLAYAHGRGVAKDEALAVRWFRKAAEQGDVKAQNSFGFYIHSLSCHLSDDDA